MHDHRLISHKEAKTAHTFNHQTEEQTHNLPLIGEVRRSKRISDKEKPNYFELARGGTLHTTEGTTVVAQHVTKVHDRDNFESKIIARESSWYRRGIKEALAILKHKPKLNEDHGRHPISQIYTIIPEYDTNRAAKVRVGDDNQSTGKNSTTGDDFSNKRRTEAKQMRTGDSTTRGAAARNVIPEQF